MVDSSHTESVRNEADPPTCSCQIFLIFFCLVQTGNDGSGTQTFMDKIEASDSYAALLWSTAGTTMITLIFYMVQITRDGKIIIPDAAAIKELFISEKAKQEDPIPKARSVMSLRDSMDSFLVGVSRVFPASIVLTLAWASGSIMTAVGCDRLFAGWIVGGLNPQVLPTLSFLISLFMALAVSFWAPATWSFFIFFLITRFNFLSSDGNFMGNNEHFVPTAISANLRSFEWRSSHFLLHSGRSVVRKRGW